ncbi:MAG: hypothetical protein M1607_03260 [Patescibacteria group bacterium]|nr:hypothetical protein [Patescibacteria group bacterium]
MSKGFIPAIILILAAASLALLGVFYYIYHTTSTSNTPLTQTNLANLSQPSPTPTPEPPLDLINWPVITSGKCGFSFTYPKGWRVKISENIAGTCLYQINNPKNSAQSMIVSMIKGKTWNQILQENPQGQEVTINGVTFLKLPNTDLTGMGIYFTNNDAVYNLLYLTYPSSINSQQSFDKIINSITFNKHN